jgi:hypothetical protein
LLDERRFFFIHLMQSEHNFTCLQADKF